MPGWKTHIWFGMSGIVPILLVFIVLQIRHPSSVIYLAPQIPLFSTLGFLLSISLFLSILLGTLLPDVDGGGKVTLYIPPFFGGYSLFLFYSSRYLRCGGIIRPVGEDITLPLVVFTTATLLSYGVLFIPKKHRGVLHHPITAIIFGLFWALGHYLFWKVNPYGVLLLFITASYGYSLHLILDWISGIRGKLV